MERLSAVLMDRKQVRRLIKVETVCKVWKDEEIATIRYVLMVEEEEGFTELPRTLPRSYRRDFS